MTPIEAPAADGAGAFTRDGCAVEVYRRLPLGDEARVVDALAGPAGSVLDLGAGVGRIADPLVRLGHSVVAVDDSREMLSHVRLAATVCAPIEDLRLEDRFDVVLLASHLINTPDRALRDGLLETVAHHLADEGRALVQWHPPEWFDSLEAGQTYSGRIGAVVSELTVHSLEHDLIHARASYRVGRTTWRQRFAARRWRVDQLVDCLVLAGLELCDDLSVPDGWLVARRADRDRSSL